MNSRKNRRTVAGVVQLEEHRAAVDVLDRVDPELEGGHHPEVAATAAQRPEQVGVLVLAGHQELAVGGHDIGRDQVVARQPVAAGQVADAAAQGEPTDAGRGDDPAGGGQPEGVGRGVEVPPGGAAFGSCRPGRRVDAHLPHARQVDDHTVVAGAEAGHAVPATSHGEVELVLAGEVHRGDHVTRVRAPHHGRRAPVDHGVVDPARSS